MFATCTRLLQMIYLALLGKEAQAKLTLCLQHSTSSELIHILIKPSLTSKSPILPGHQLLCFSGSCIGFLRNRTPAKTIVKRTLRQPQYPRCCIVWAEDVHETHEETVAPC